MMWPDLGFGLICPYSFMGNGSEGEGTGGRQTFNSAHDPSPAPQIRGARGLLGASH